MLELFTPLRGLGADITKIQASIEEAFKKLLRAFPLVDGVLLQDIHLDTTLRQFEHGLGRKPIGYIVVRRSTGAVVYDDTPPTDRHIFFKASVTTTCSLWVF